MMRSGKKQVEWQQVCGVLGRSMFGAAPSRLTEATERFIARVGACLLVSAPLYVVVSVSFQASRLLLAAA